MTWPDPYPNDVNHPDPEELFANPQHPRPWEVVSALADAGLLTERQAEVYVRRVLEAEPGYSVAEDLGIGESAISDYKRDAADKIEAARRTVAILDAYRFPDLPDECTECGATLGGRWVEDDAGAAICLDCAGVDPADMDETA